jgi:hypothetical protein
MVNVTEANWNFRSLIASGGRKEFAETAAPFRGCPVVQQSMGHLASLSAKDKDKADFVSAGAASRW